MLTLAFLHIPLNIYTSTCAALVSFLFEREKLLAAQIHMLPVDKNQIRRKEASLSQQSQGNGGEGSDMSVERG